jgi:uroporphyrin-III C-methyltransferase/precorrin-2 dehydrogenase/sirohydrochlorin ferrochelatase
MLNVRNRRCLVVGGGGVAFRKVQGLLAENAEITVIAPKVLTSFEQLSNEGKISLILRSFQDEDVDGFHLVFAATDDNEVNRRVFHSSEAAGIWVNVADEPHLCSFHLPARLQRGSLQVIVASGGDAPFVVRRLRQLLEVLFGQEWCEWISSAARFRKAVKSEHLTPSQEQACFDRFFSSTVDGNRFVVSVPSYEQQSQWITEIHSEKPKKTDKSYLPQESAETKSKVGMVSLVGGGPGDAGLLTVRGRNRLLAANAVVYDHLAETVLPVDLPAETELHPVGKKAGYHPVPQSEISSLLVQLAKQGKRVVRLKGGDPFVFGRGGEEAEELAKAGIPFEVVPGVTAGIAVPAYAGIPVTNRKEAVRVTLLTAHEAVKRDGPQQRWDLLAQDKASTLVGYMGVTSLPEVVHNLLSSAMDPSTPAAMIEKGTTSQQRMVKSRLKDLPAEVERLGIKPPALFVIGHAVEHADRLNWFTQRPLSGQRILVPLESNLRFDSLESAGAEIIEVPLPLTPAARIVIDANPITGCIVTNPTDVEILDEERARPGWGSNVRIWCLNEETEGKALRLGWRNLMRIGDSVTSETDLAVVILKNLF